MVTRLTGTKPNTFEIAIRAFVARRCPGLGGRLASLFLARDGIAEGTDSTRRVDKRAGLPAREPGEGLLGESAGRGCPPTGEPGIVTDRPQNHLPGYAIGSGYCQLFPLVELTAEPLKLCYLLARNPSTAS